MYRSNEDTNTFYPRFIIHLQEMAMAFVCVADNVTGPMVPHLH